VTKLTQTTIGLLILLSVFFLFNNQLNPSHFGKSSDEGYYLLYAKTIYANGPEAFNGLIKWYNESLEAQKHPSPIRYGYILLLSSSFELFGVSFSTIALISIISFVLFLILCFYKIRDYFNEDIALLTTLFLSSSPLLLGLSRRALADSLITFLWAGVFWAFLDVLARRSRHAHAALIIFLTAAIAVKESSIILLGFIVLISFVANRQGYSISMKQLYGIIILPILLTMLAYIFMYGGISGLNEILASIFSTHLQNTHSNPYAIKYSSGPWFRYLVDFMLLTPIITLLFLAYVGMHLQKKDKCFYKTYALLFFAFIAGVLSCLPHSKVVRFVASLEMVMALCAAWALNELLKGRMLFYAVSLIVMYNWISFFNIFYKPALLDPISYHLFTLRHFAPG
jgi:4-amino-4-deoxy-L-arabinose transferase-like glycosyltransferase